MSAIQRTKFSSFHTVVIDFTEIVNAQKGDAELQQLIDSNSSIKIPPPNEGSGIHTSLKQDLKDSTAKLLYGTTLHLPGDFSIGLTCYLRYYLEVTQVLNKISKAAQLSWCTAQH